VTFYISALEIYSYLLTYLLIRHDLTTFGGGKIGARLETNLCELIHTITNDYRLISRSGHGT